MLIFRLARWFDFTNLITENKKSQQCVLYTGLLNSGYFLEPVARN